VSENLATQVQVALEALGIATHKATREPTEDSFGLRPKHHVRVSGVHSTKLFQEKIGFISKEKGRKLSKGLADADFVEDRLGGISNQAMIDEFYTASAGLPSKVRQDISARKTQGKFNLNWALNLVSTYAQLASTKIAALKPLAEARVYFVQVKDNESGKTALTYDLSVPNNNTYVAGGFVSHNTIAFMMDCDTTGVEPAMGLVTYKDMVGGGTMKITVDAVPEALIALGYSTLVIPKILQYISDNGYAEGCPEVKEEHLPVFDCAFAAKTRMVSVEGHINMCAAVQPFLSGAISKTFNMPRTATVDEVKRAYMMAWERGLKGVAIYRQGSKFSEPMRAREVLAAVEEKKSVVPTRKELPTTIISVRHVFNVGAHKIHLHCGLDPKTGDIMEIFIRAGGFGSTVGGLLDSYATLFSKSLQYGIPLDICIKHMEGSNFPPAGVTSNAEIPMVKSIMDYVARWMKKEFIDKKAAPIVLEHPDTENGVAYVPHADDAETSSLSEDTCPKCGHLMVRTGSCTMCKNCSHNSGVCG
jgi:ribonucleoside-diphosphate reductase alpha chain